MKKDYMRYYYIWFSVPGGTQGFHIDEVNDIIKKWNDETFKLYQFGTFCDYFTYETGTTVYGFHPIWNDHNPLMNQLTRIKGKFTDY